MSENIDTLCLTMLELVAEIHQKKLEQEKHMQEGYLCLAKARYSMGVDRVSSLQYPNEITPTVTISCRNQPPTSAVRRRKKTKKDDHNEARQAVEEVDLLSQDKLHAQVNPLLWFGVLVPTPLRQAQNCFRQATEVSCQLCTLKEELNYKTRLYKEVMKPTETKG
uniref:coiled-coil domain-containing protein 115-like n=1 Tax=Ciona intestinalis TaxID=7719 RepID=UPI000180CD22|nr:coiled-coil domain-containing protein 115-like [Ciona intestinalis]|eukprot:XP_009857845.1 coiled-coil domain-containing protein 115-like [Ciona intestinalis]